jgi:hypothetical protein
MIYKFDQANDLYVKIIYLIKLINHLLYQTYKSFILSTYKAFTYQTYKSFTLSTL